MFQFRVTTSVRFLLLKINVDYLSRIYYSLNTFSVLIINCLCTGPVKTHFGTSSKKEGDLEVHLDRGSWYKTGTF